MSAPATRAAARAAHRTGAWGAGNPKFEARNPEEIGNFKNPKRTAERAASALLLPSERFEFPFGFRISRFGFGNRKSEIGN
jgi:hypothetical protein